ncbi:MAG TPA: tetratricopeptide repeat protein [Fimbriimonadaceae bacterium]|nr:tetratricopeptide repeat protein [Fimbriimonadaceae bacterium]
MSVALKAFLFTDIEGSTRKWSQYGEAMQGIVERHDRLLTDAVRKHGGHVFKTTGDGICACFAGGLRALAAAVEMAQEIRRENWRPCDSFAIRIAIHAGEAFERDGDYFGPTLNKVARLMAIAHGGQIIASGAVIDALAGSMPESVKARSLGEHRLKDLDRAEHIYQLIHPALPQDFPPLKSLSVLKNNLPVQLTSFVGRKRELDEVVDLISGNRLVSLTGSGGTGKTRLALHAAGEVVGQFEGGVFLVELAPLADPQQVCGAIQEVLRINDDERRSGVDALVEAIGNDRLLLILDNCEHVLEAVSELTHKLLIRTGCAAILATSREGLGVPGERVYRVPSLDVPDEATANPDSVWSCEASRLFLERASQTGQEISLDDESARNLARLCRRLDGIPLAIELAAARTRSMSIDKVVERLDDRFRLLTGGSKAVLPRQQTLRALIDWSYDLLRDEEKTLLRRLAVFSGGWTLEAAEAVCANRNIDALDVLDLLDRLIDKSLVVFDPAADRYRFLETVRQYAADRLLESGEGIARRDRHLSFFVAWTDEWRLKEREFTQPAWLRLFHADWENVRAALEWSLGSADLVENGALLATRSFRFWNDLRRIRDASYWIGRFLADPSLPNPSETRMLLTQYLAVMQAFGNDTDASAQSLQAAIAMAEALQDAQLRGQMLAGACWISFRSGRYEDALGYAAEILDDLASPDLAKGYAYTNRANSMFMLGRLEEARTAMEQGLAVRASAGDTRGVGGAHTNLGMIAFRQGRLAEAKQHYLRALEVFEALDSDAQLSIVGPGILNVLLNEADPACLARLYGSSLEAMNRLQNFGDQVDSWGQEITLATLRERLGQDFERQRELGAKIPLRQAIGAVKGHLTVG